MTASPPHCRTIDTETVRPDERVQFWEEAWRSRRLAFRCSPHAEEGLRARQVSVNAGILGVALTSANAHVIERTAETVRAFPCESVFVNIVRTGGTFMYQRGHCMKVQAGEMLVYDARHPYLLGGAPSFELIHVDIPVALFQSRLARADMSRPLHISAGDGTNRLYQRTLSALLMALLDGRTSSSEATDGLDQQVCDLLGALVGQATGQASLSALSAGHLLAAKAYVEEHLIDAALCSQDVAIAIGISERHLRRLFAVQDTSLTDYVFTRRLERAHAALRDPQQRSATVAETAYRCGFASHAHFSRAFKQRFGVTPSELLCRH